VQTFLPYSSFEKSAKCLDRLRLNKQRVEAYQIFLILTSKSKTNAWVNHPAVLMWKGYEWKLLQYIYAICNEWISRGYKDTIKNKCSDLDITFTSFDDPSWLGNHSFHRSHKSNLLRKKADHYSKFDWNIPDNLDYIWPVKKEIINVA
jgi:hypothetical protein